MQEKSNIINAYPNCFRYALKCVDIMYFVLTYGMFCDIFLFEI